MTKNIYKHLCLLGITLFLVGFAQAQTPPNAFNYSAVARNVAGQPIATSKIGIQISILKTSTTGAVQYSENHIVTTDAFGLFNLAIGEGTVQSGSMSAITWGTDKYFIKVGMDVAGSTNFLTMGTTQLMSVPYALHSKTADSIVGVNSKIELDPVFNASVAKNITAKDTIKWNSYSNPTNEFQTLSISNDTIYLSNGGFVRLPNISGGKTYIELFGDVTDAQADSIIKADLGPNTKFIYITNTTKLTTIDLSVVKTLMEFKITGNEVLVNVNASPLQRCSQILQIGSNPLLATLLTDKLSYVGNLDIYSNDKLSALNFPLLKKALDINIRDNKIVSTFSAVLLTSATNIIINNNGLTNLNLTKLTTLISVLDIQANTLLSTMSASSLTTASYISIGNNGLTNLNLTALTTLSQGLNIEGNTKLTSLTANSLNTNQSISIRNNGLISLSLPALTTSLYLNIEGNTALTDFSANSLNTTQSISILNNGLISLSLPALTTSVYLNIEGNTALTSLSLPTLTTLSGDFTVTNNTSLNTLNISSLSKITKLNLWSNKLNNIIWSPLINSLGGIEVYGNELPSSEINDILAFLVAAGQSGSNVNSNYWLFNQTPPAPPTGQGITDKTTIKGWGISIMTDN
jgi:hypothetical protein